MRLRCVPRAPFLVRIGRLRVDELSVGELYVERLVVRERAPAAPE
jgi:hypothetical protein